MSLWESKSGIFNAERRNYGGDAKFERILTPSSDAITPPISSEACEFFVLG
jgi:hypothetical protein